MTRQQSSPLVELANAGKYQGIENRIKEVSVSLPAQDKTKITGRFFYLDFSNSEPNQEMFIENMFREIDRYCIPRKEFRKAENKYDKDRDESVFIELHEKAVRLFVYSNRDRGAHLGEPAELIAFMLLEAFFDAPQIACKMSLKTSTSMPVHGADAIHMRYHEDTECLDIIWGEAKLYTDLQKGINEAIESVNHFVTLDKDTGIKPQNRDIEIIKDFPDVDNDAMQQAICDYFDPYSDKSSKVQHIYSCFVGYDETIYKNLQGSTQEEIEEYFKKKYIEKAVKTYNTFSQKVKNEGLSEMEFVLLLLPFKDIQKLRDEFRAKLRVTPND